VRESGGKEAFELETLFHEGVEVRVSVVCEKAVDFAENVVEPSAVAEIFDGVGQLNGEQREIIVVERGVFHVGKPRLNGILLGNI
jgi:hypothetical protein